MVFKKKQFILLAAKHMELFVIVCLFEIICEAGGVLALGLKTGVGWGTAMYTVPCLVVIVCLFDIIYVHSFGQSIKFPQYCSNAGVLWDL